jgi:hypothetical protein
MYEFCPEHGERLTEVGDFRQFWCSVYRCPARNCCGYLEVGDPRSLPLLIQLDVGILAKLAAASPPLLKEAFGRIKRIDYKTASIVFFEHTLNGAFRKEAEYRVIYPGESDDSRS